MVLKQEKGETNVTILFFEKISWVLIKMAM